MTTARNREIDAIRTIVALPAGHWQPHDHDTLDAARTVLADLLGRHDRGAAAKREAQQRRQTPRPKRARKPSELLAGEHFATVRSGGRCEHPSGCTDTATVHHHRAGRTRHDSGALMHLCEHHHRHTHANPAESYGNGAMVHRHGLVVDPLGWMT